ncbi:MAG TPA: hypothetical protein VFL51_02765 [Pseudolabrys sp.]|nr:hypothetical protein [Pseudolabrys sp.]
MLARNLLRVSVVLILIGMAGGIGMGIAQDFRLAPAHAHLNLVGFVALFLAGLYYNAAPHAAATALAKIHAWTAVIGAIVFPIGIGVVAIKGEQFVVLPIVGSLIVFVGMALFAWIVFRNGLSKADAQRA